MNGKERNFKEKDFQQMFGAWARHNLNTNALLELKVSKTDSLPFSRLEDHQFSALKAAKHNRLFFKIPDGSMGRLPADAFMLAKSEAWIVIMFRCTEYGNRCFYMVDVDAWETEMAGPRRSLTEDRARSIGYAYFLA